MDYTQTNFLIAYNITLSFKFVLLTYLFLKEKVFFNRNCMKNDKNVDPSSKNQWLHI